MRLYGQKYTWIKGLSKRGKNVRCRTWSRSQFTGICCHNTSTTVSVPIKSMVTRSGLNARRSVKLKYSNRQVHRSRQSLKIYFGLDKKGLKPYVNSVKNGLSPVAILELRSDVILLRSGIVNSIRHARYLISNGHLNIWSSESDGKYGWQQIVGASQKVSSGTVIRFNPEYYYKTLIKQIADRSNGTGAFNSMPGHLIVDYSSGMIIVVRKPVYDDNFLLPKGSTQHAYSLTTY